jgi:gamma-glutamyltranspeptidase / glutathione hydrolase
MRRRVGIRTLSIVLVLTVLAVPGAADTTVGSRWRDSVTSDRGVVVADSPLAAQEGINILNAGGNAIDAAVATVFALGVTRFEMCGVGGGGFLVYRGADGTTASLDFRETSPRQGYEFSKGLGYEVSKGLLDVSTPFTFGTGHGVIGVPGLVAGLEAAVDKLGSMPFGDLVSPAARLARDGFPVSPATAFHMTQLGNRVRYFPEAARVYLKGGVAPYLAGEDIWLPDYADVLDALAAGGSRVFYEGWIAERIVEEMQRPSPYPGDRSALTLADFAAYEPVWRDPLTATYRKHQVIAMPPPTSGGTAIVEMLNILNSFEFDPSGHLSADHIHLLAEAQKIAWADRGVYLGDPDHLDERGLRIQRELTSKRYAATRAADIDMELAQDHRPGSFGAIPPPEAASPTEEEGSHTSHVSVIDAAGNAVAVTCSIELPFGSAVVAPGTGFLLNNELTDFSDPGSGSANEPGPGKRPRSSMSPTIVVYRGKPVLVTGAAGGAKIIMGVLQMITNHLDFGLDLDLAIDAARVDARAFGPVLNLENARIEQAVIDELAERGHEIGSSGEYAGDPIVNAAGFDKAARVKHAVSDPRADEADQGARGQ